jgi:hypothetical protein
MGFLRGFFRRKVQIKQHGPVTSTSVFRQLVLEQSPNEIEQRGLQLHSLIASSHCGAVIQKMPYLFSYEATSQSSTPS